MNPICQYGPLARKVLLLFALITAITVHAAAQAFPNIRAGSEVNPLGSNPSGPAGAVFIGNRMWIGDQVFGLVRCDPLDPANTDPLTSGFIAPVPASSAPGIVKGGQLVLDPFLTTAEQATLYVADYSGKTGGVKRVVIDVASQTVLSVTKIASTAGLEGNNPTALAYGPDGNLYVGFLKNGDIKRIVNPSVGNLQAVETVGTSANGRKVRGIAFIGTSLYLATEDGLGLISNATNTVGQIPQSVRVGADGDGLDHPGITSDGVAKLYYLTSGSIGVVYELNTANGWNSFISFFGVGADMGARAYHFPKGHSSLVAIDPNGDLWVGDDPGGDAIIVTGIGRIFAAPASWLHLAFPLG